jgi:hypothetical protein
MKKRRNIFFHIIILLIVLFFFLGIDVHSNSETQRYYVEYASGSNDFENKLNHHIDTSEEDQMEQSHLMLLPEQSECQKSGINSLPLLDNLFVSVWQPPKIF